MEKNKITSHAINKFLGYDLIHKPTNCDIFALIKKVEDYNSGAYITILRSDYEKSGQGKTYTFTIIQNQAPLYTHTAFSCEAAILECIGMFAKDVIISENFLYSK